MKPYRNLAAAVIWSLVTPLTALAVTDTWDGGGADNNLTTNNNWLDNTAPASNFLTTDLIFAGTTNTSVNFNTSFAANSLTFDGSAGLFLLSASGGQTLTLNAAGITNKDTGRQTLSGIGINVALASTTLDADKGHLVIDGPISLGTATLNVLGNADTAIHRPITGTGVVNKSGTGTLVLPSNTTLSVDLTIAGGTVAIPSTGTTTFDANSWIQINGGTFNADGNLTINGGILQKSTGAGFNLADGKVFTLNNTGADFDGGFSLNAATVNISGIDAQFSAFAGGLSLNSGAQFNVTAGALLQIGSGTIALGGAGSPAALVVDGPQSAMVAEPGIVAIGRSGGAGSATFRNFSFGSAGTLYVGTSTTPGSSGTLNIEGGASFHTEFAYVGQTAGDSGTVTVTGATFRASILGLGMSSGSTAVLNVQNGGYAEASRAYVGATGTINLNGGSSNFYDLTVDAGRINRDATGYLAFGTLTIQNGGDVLIAGDYGLTTIGEIEISGRGSTFVQSGSGAFELGIADVEMATMTVTHGGAFTSGTGTATLNATGTININDGTVIFNGPLVHNGGKINLSAGTLSFVGHLTVGTGGMLGTDLVLNSNQRLFLDGITTIDTAHTLTLNGGTFYTGTLVPNGTFDFRRGTLRINGAFGLTIGAGGSLGNSVTLGAGQTLSVYNVATINSGALLVLDSGGAFASRELANNGTVVLTGAAAVLGGALVTNSGLIRGEGTVTANVTNTAAGEIRAQADKTLTLGGVNGINAGTINLQGGAIDFAQALTNGATGRILGRGTLRVGGTGLDNQGHVAFSSGITDVFGDVVNNTSSTSVGIAVSGNADVTFWDDVQHVVGSLFRVSAGSSATFFGGFSGAGFSGTGDVFFEADISPGASPALVEFAGNVSFGDGAALEIELGGLTPGSQFDELHVEGLLSLGGALEVSFIDGFRPALGNSFDILDWGNLSGTFSSISLPDLGSLAWDTSQLYTAGVLAVAALVIAGDYNQNGTVDAADYIVWRKYDGTANGYNTWRANFGRTAGAGSGAINSPRGDSPGDNSPVPEPKSLFLLVCVLVSSLNFRVREFGDRAAQ